MPKPPRFRRLQTAFAALAAIGIVGCLAIAAMHGSGVLVLAPAGIAAVALATGVLMLALLLQLLDVLATRFRDSEVRPDIGISTLGFPPAPLAPLPPRPHRPLLRRIK